MPNFIKAIQNKIAKAAGLPSTYHVSVNVMASVSFTRIYEVKAHSEDEATRLYEEGKAALYDELAVEAADFENVEEVAVLCVEEIE